MPLRISRAVIVERPVEVVRAPPPSVDMMKVPKSALKKPLVTALAISPASSADATLKVFERRDGDFLRVLRRAMQSPLMTAHKYPVSHRDVMEVACRSLAQAPKRSCFAFPLRI